MTAKAKTTNGKQIANFTLLCDFKPMHQRVNPDTGAVIERWTYRSDLENEKHAKSHDGFYYKNELDALGNIYNLHSHKFLRARLYDNRKPAGQQLLAEWKQGKLVYPYETERKVKCANWLKNIK